jgi:TPR repeat protein
MPDLTKAAKYYERAAAMGNSSAQRAIGTQYFWGAGVAQSADNAAKWLQAAAASGSTQAFADLAVLNNSAMVTTITPGLAFTYNFEAAKRNYVPAMLEVGISLVQGFGIPANPASGISWLERAANAGSNEAMYDLYQIYVEGYGVGKNPAHADKWLQVAAASGNGSALFRQALTLMSVKTPEAESQAVALLKKAAKVKHNQSKKLLVKMGLMSPSDADDGGEVEVEAIE